MDGRQEAVSGWGVASRVNANGARAVYALLFLTLINAFSNIDRSVFSILLPLIKRDLKLSDAVLGALSGTAFAVSYSLLSLPFAFLADRRNRKRLIAIGFGCWSAVTALTGATASAAQLAAARFLLGAAEASSLAPSTSIIADLFELRRRVFALAVLGTSASIGLLVSFPIIGWLGERFGWRAAFVAVGVPGVIAALIFQLTVGEPARADAPGHARAGGLETLRFLCGSPAYLLLLAGGALSAFELGAFISWTPTFLMRVHHLGPAQVGALVGMARGPAGIAGSLGVGFVATRLTRTDIRWHARVPAIAMMLLCPADLALLFSPSPQLWGLSLMLDAFCAAAVVGPCFAVSSSVSRPQMRSVAAALFLVFAGLTGQSLGPFLVGWLNDRLAPLFGLEAVRFSLACASAGALLGGIAYWVCGRFMPADARRAAQ